MVGRAQPHDETRGDQATTRPSHWLPFWAVVGLDATCITLTGLVELDAMIQALNDGKDVCSGVAYDEFACKTSMSLATRATSLFQVVGGLSSILTIPVIGHGADVWGRKLLFVLIFLSSEVPALALACISYLQFSIYAYLAARMIPQMLPASILFQLWINDCTAPEERIKIFARLAAFQSMEGVLVPLMVKFIHGKQVVWLIVFSRLLAASIAACCLKESFQPRSTRARFALSQAWKSIRESWRHVPYLCSFKATRSIFLLGFFATGTGAANISILFPFCKARFGVSQETFAPLLIVQTASNAVVQFLITPRLGRCCSLRVVFAIGLICGGVNLAVSAFSPSFSVLLVMAVVAGFGSVATPAFQTLMTNFVDNAGSGDRDRGVLLCTLQAFQNLFVVLMPPFYQALFSVFVNPSVADGRLLALPMLFGAVCQIISTMILLSFNLEVFNPQRPLVRQ